MKALSLTLCAILAMLSATTQPAGEKVVKPDGLTIITTGKGAASKVGDTVYVLYTGMSTEGKIFDASSMHGNEPITLKLGSAQVIKGWEEGLLDMQVGEKRRLIIPPELAYGAAGRGDKIPPNSTLEFDVELVGLLRTQ